MDNKKRLEDSCLYVTAIFFAFPAMFIIGNSGRDSFTFKEGLTITLIVYLVNFTVSILYVTIGLPENSTFKKRITVLRRTLLFSSWIITTPFYLFYSIREFVYKTIERIKNKEPLISFDNKKMYAEIKDYIYQERRIKRKKFVSENEFESNRKKLIQQIKESVDYFQKNNINELKFQFYFITNEVQKAKQLTSIVKNRYLSVHCENSLEDRRLLVISAWTPKMKITDEVLIKWINEMCELGHQYDCNFESWSTEYF